MNKIGFFTPISRGNFNNNTLQSVEVFDDYFYFGGKKCVVIKDNGGNQFEVNEVNNVSNSSKDLINLLKVISYITVLVPIIMLIGKVVTRFKCEFLNGKITLNATVTIQSHMRSMLARRRFKKEVDAVVKIQSHFRALKARKEFNKEKAAIKNHKAEQALKVQEQLKQENAAVKIQSHVRSLLARKEFEGQVKAAVVIQSQVRSFLARKEFENMKTEHLADTPPTPPYFPGDDESVTESFQQETTIAAEAAIKIQSHVRSLLARTQFKSQVKAAVVIQSHVRSFLARKEIEQISTLNVGIPNGEPCQPTLPSDDESATDSLVDSSTESVVVSEDFKSKFRKYQELKDQLKEIEAAVRAHPKDLPADKMLAQKQKQVQSQVKIAKESFESKEEKQLFELLNKAQELIKSGQSLKKGVDDTLEALIHYNQKNKADLFAVEINVLRQLVQGLNQYMIILKENISNDQINALGLEQLMSSGTFKNLIHCVATFVSMQYKLLDKVLKPAGKIKTKKSKSIGKQLLEQTEIDVERSMHLPMEQFAKIPLLLEEMIKVAPKSQKDSFTNVEKAVTAALFEVNRKKLETEMQYVDSLVSNCLALQSKKRIAVTEHGYLYLKKKMVMNKQPVIKIRGAQIILNILESAKKQGIDIKQSVENLKKIPDFAKLIKENGELEKQFHLLAFGDNTISLLKKLDLSESLETEDDDTESLAEGSISKLIDCLKDLDIESDC